MPDPILDQIDLSKLSERELGLVRLGQLSILYRAAGNYGYETKRGKAWVDQAKLILRKINL